MSERLDKSLMESITDALSIRDGKGKRKKEQPAPVAKPVVAKPKVSEEDE
jgi:hypothetical protein